MKSPYENDKNLTMEFFNILPSHSGFSRKALEYYFKKKYMGIIPDADHVAEMTGTCGDTMTIYLKINQDIIIDATFMVQGCIGTVTAAMAAGHLIIGKSLARARSIDDSDIFRELEDVPAQKHHCIQLAVKTVHHALDTYTARHS